MKTHEKAFLEFNKSVSKTIMIKPPASKSEANRVLIVNALAGNVVVIKNLASARDTQTMQRLLQEQTSEIWDVLDAGTTMRFCTAFSAIGKVNRTMTGTVRMQERPIGILTNALIELGAQVIFEKKEGYPPFKIIPISEQLNRKIDISGAVSSQFISALLMIAPVLPKGLEMNLIGKIGSRPYIDLTIGIMRQFGIAVTFEDRTIKVAHQSYQWSKPKQAYTVESDWSGASYWFSYVALSENSKVILKGYHQKSMQGDSVLTSLTKPLGVNATFNEEGDLVLQKTDHSSFFEFDFTHCPDLAQTIAVICAAKGIKAKFSGLESLKVKETDRIAALIAELDKFNVKMIEIQEGVCSIEGQCKFGKDPVRVNTYEDHRMAMAFAPLALYDAIEIENPAVVNKSYPEFWDQMEEAGIISSFT